MYFNFYDIFAPPIYTRIFYSPSLSLHHFVSPTVHTSDGRVDVLTLRLLALLHAECCVILPSNIFYLRVKRIATTNYAASGSWRPCSLTSMCALVSLNLFPTIENCSAGCLKPLYTEAMRAWPPSDLSCRIYYSYPDWLAVVASFLLAWGQVSVTLLVVVDMYFHYVIYSFYQYTIKQFNC